MASDPNQGLPAAALVQFKVLQQHFVAGLTERWAAVANAMTPEELQAQLHRLAGAAGSYGFVGLGECAKAAELLATGSDKMALTQALSVLEAQIKAAQTLATND